MWDFAHEMIQANLRREHPEWMRKSSSGDGAAHRPWRKLVNERELAHKVAATFETLGIPYFITGSMASIALGEPRFTNDVDVVADIPLSAIPALLAAYPPPEFYLSESAVREAVSRRFQFNIIHIASGLKVDVMVPSADDFNRSRMGRILRLNFDVQRTGWFASPEDVILKKLQYFREGGSEKHLRDIAGVLTVQGERIDQAYLNGWAAKLGVSDELEMVRDRLKSKS